MRRVPSTCLLKALTLGDGRTKLKVRWEVREESSLVEGLAGLRMGEGADTGNGNLGGGRASNKARGRRDIIIELLRGLEELESTRGIRTGRD